VRDHGRRMLGSEPCVSLHIAGKFLVTEVLGAQDPRLQGLSTRRGEWPATRSVLFYLPKRKLQYSFNKRLSGLKRLSGRTDGKEGNSAPANL
jgi:hypothetical protein